MEIFAAGFIAGLGCGLLWCSSVAREMLDDQRKELSKSSPLADAWDTQTYIDAFAGMEGAKAKARVLSHDPPLLSREEANRIVAEWKPDPRTNPHRESKKLPPPPPPDYDQRFDIDPPRPWWRCW